MDRIKKRYKIFIAINKGVHLLEGVFGMLQSVLSARQFLYLSSVLVAISSGLAVIVLKTFAHKVFEFTTYVNALIKLPYINSILPVAGILLTVLVVRKFLGGKIEKGTSQVMIAVARHSGFMPKKQMYAQIVTSSLTVGMGGSAGLESPIAITGAAFGSNYAKSFHLNYKQRTLLLACGVAAGHCRCAVRYRGGAGGYERFRIHTPDHIISHRRADGQCIHAGEHPAPFPGRADL